MRGWASQVQSSGSYTLSPTASFMSDYHAVQGRQAASQGIKQPLQPILLPAYWVFSGSHVYLEWALPRGRGTLANEEQLGNRSHPRGADDPSPRSQEHSERRASSR